MRSGEPSRISLRKRWISLTLRARLKWLAGVIHIAQMLCTVWNFNTLNSNSFQFLRGIDMESDNMKKALIAMSGGVDSSVAAYLMKDIFWIPSITLLRNASAKILLIVPGREK